MSPFGSTNGGSLSDDQIDAIVAFIRNWEANPPGVPPPQAPSPQPSITAEQIFAGICSQCHGPDGEGGSGPALNTPEFQAKYDDQALADLISQGVPATPMIGVGDVFADDQIRQLVSLIRNLEPGHRPPAASRAFPGRFCPFFRQNAGVSWRDQHLLYGTHPAMSPYDKWRNARSQSRRFRIAASPSISRDSGKLMPRRSLP
jgi:mono/diheme cytochrome c family protein